MTSSPLRAVRAPRRPCRRCAASQRRQFLLFSTLLSLSLACPPPAHPLFNRTPPRKLAAAPPKSIASPPPSKICSSPLTFPPRAAAAAPSGGPPPLRVSRAPPAPRFVESGRPAARHLEAWVMGAGPIACLRHHTPPALSSSKQLPPPIRLPLSHFFFFVYVCVCVLVAVPCFRVNCKEPQSIKGQPRDSRGKQNKPHHRTGGDRAYYIRDEGTKGCTTTTNTQQETMYLTLLKNKRLLTTAPWPCRRRRRRPPRARAAARRARAP